MTSSLVKNRLVDLKHLKRLKKPATISWELGD